MSGLVGKFEADFSMIWHTFYHRFCLFEHAGAVLFIVSVWGLLLLTCIFMDHR